MGDARYDVGTVPRARILAQYQCRDIISWIGGGPRSTVGIAMEEEGVVVEVAHCFCVCLSVLACSIVP